MYSGGLVADKASTIGIEISPSPNFHRGCQKLRNLASFKTSYNFESPAFENPARYPKSETKVQRYDDCPMPWPSLVKSSPRIPEKALWVVPHPLKLHAKTCQIVNNSAVDYSISLKFCTELKHRTPKGLKKFRSRSQRSRSQRDTTCAKIRKIINNSAMDWSLWITWRLTAFNLGTEFHYVTRDTLQMFKVKGQGHRVK